MKTKLIALMIACSLPAFAADKIEDVLKTLRSPDPAPVKAYIAEHPDAADVAKARHILAEIYKAIDKPDEGIAVLQK